MGFRRSSVRIRPPRPDTISALSPGRRPSETCYSRALFPVKRPSQDLLPDRDERKRSALDWYSGGLLGPAESLIPAGHGPVTVGSRAFHTRGAAAPRGGAGPF